MVVPGLLETMSPRGDVRKAKKDWASPLEYIVEKMGAENLRMTQGRLLAALVWSFVLGCTVYRRFDLGRLRWVLMLHHLLAALGLDEALLMSFSAQEPFALRLLRPGAVVTPWAPSFLPKQQSVLGATAYASFVILAIYQLILYRVSDQDVSVFLALFLLACIFDRGLFHSTRPSDILKFLAATLLQEPALNVYTLLACLYFWSGLYKLRGFFHGFMFQYQFLNFSAISWYFRHLYLTEEYLPRPAVCAFGAAGTWIEMLAGLGMILGALPGSSEWFILLALAMHVFIFFFGMGPFRWNVMTMYMLICSAKLCLEQGFSGRSLWKDPGSSGLYLFIFGVGIPFIGTSDPQTLGRYFGGYRMATFHFAGNETYRALLVKKAAVLAEEPLGARGPLRQLLRDRARGYERLTQDEDMFTALLYADGLNVEGSLRRGFQAPSGLTDFDEFDRTYMFVPITWLNCRGPLLNTKWDESLPVTERFVELVCETLAASEEPRLAPGTALQFVAHVVPWLGGRTKRLELFDLTASKWSASRWVEDAELPWLPHRLRSIAQSGLQSTLL
ncbi:unnamed protein product [Symbiodinium sp. CCMP2456]|nr:unnamed protein product [Symbiodinium sp. CCMP2456]